MGLDFSDSFLKLFKSVETFGKTPSQTFRSSLKSSGSKPSKASSVFVNSMSIAMNENSIITGDKNGSVFSIAPIALFVDWIDSVKFINCEELISIQCLINRRSDSVNSVSNKKKQKPQNNQQVG